MTVRSFILQNPAPILARRPALKEQRISYTRNIHSKFWFQLSIQPLHRAQDTYTWALHHAQAFNFETALEWLHQKLWFNAGLAVLKHLPAVPKTILFPSNCINCPSFPSSAKASTSPRVFKFYSSEEYISDMTMTVYMHSTETQGSTVGDLSQQWY